MIDTSKLSNGKYFKGSFKNYEESKGWFVGSFFDDGNPLKTDKVEIKYHQHSIGDKTSSHYHKEKVEILLILEGCAKYKINDKEVILNGGDFIFIDINNIISGEFLQDSSIFAIHSPSLPKDKFIR